MRSRARNRSVEPVVSGFFGRIESPPMQPQNHGSALKQIVNRNCKVLSPNPKNPCNLKPAQNRKINSRSAVYAFFTSD